MVVVVALVAALLALGGCPTVDLGDQPAGINVCTPPGGIAYFTAQIEPTYFALADTTNGCARSSQCHDMAHGLTLQRDPPDDAANFRISQQYLNCGDPGASPLLTKPLAGIDGHGGGDLFASGSTQYNVFFGWFAGSGSGT